MWKTEQDLKMWLAERLSGVLYHHITRDDVGYIAIRGANGNGEAGSSRPYPLLSPAGAKVYPDLVGEIRIGRKVAPLYVEVVLDRGYKSLSHSFRQALQYKGDIGDVFSRRPRNVVLITTDAYLLGRPLPPSLYWFERFVWANGMGIIRRCPYTGGLLITLSEQEKYEVIS